MLVVHVVGGFGLLVLLGVKVNTIGLVGGMRFGQCWFIVLGFCGGSMLGGVIVG